MADRSAALSIARKELREAARDGRFWIVGAALAALLLVSLAFGFRQAASARSERAAAQQTADEHWREQDDKNPHVAAHYGTYVFKPSGALPFVDPGIEPFVGVSVKLEAHKQNALEGARAQDGTALQRFARLSVAGVLQLLVPLLVIGLGFAAWTSERERGTLRQLASLGLAPRSLFAGKAAGLAGALLALLSPAIVAGAVAILVIQGTGAASRLAWMAAAYAVYLGAFVAVTLFVSAVAPSSRSSLVVLLGFWVASALVVPRAAADAVARFAPAPTHAEIARKVAKSLETGLPGGPGREERVTALAEQLLEQQGFKGAETLMDASLLQGIELQAEALFENEVLDHHFSRWFDSFERQERLVQWASVASPVVAVRSASTAFAGTDYAHHRHFADAAEKHRRALVDLLNKEFADKGGALGFDYKASRELWARAPTFSYAQPGARWALERQVVSLSCLFAWLVLGAAAAWIATARMRVS